MQARHCWTVLANKAQDQCERIRQELQQLQQRLEGQQANERRLRQLYSEYHERLTQAGTASSGMQDAINQRQFMQQITTLVDKVVHDQILTRQTLAQTRQRLGLAEREKLKMQSLMEHELHRQKTAEKLQDQKLMDDLALRQFQLRQLPGHA